MPVDVDLSNQIRKRICMQSNQKADLYAVKSESGFVCHQNFSNFANQLMYNLRSQSNTDDTLSSGNPPIVTMANPILMTEEQLQSLLSGMTRALATTQNVQTATGNFANCASRFAGNKDEDIEAFISAISIYKDCVNITGENAIKGLPMLLDYNAATWWQGVKSTISTWDDAVKALRHSFGYNKPPHKIFKELFFRDQGYKEPTDLYVNSARALLARLPETPVLHLTHQLDMVYGLLNRRIRHRLPREQVTSFSELVEKSRSIEDSFAENVTSSTVPKHNSPNDDKTIRLRPKCQFCRNFGHIQADCRKYAANQERFVQSNVNQKPLATATIKCFGCGSPGYVRSQCPNCRTQYTTSGPKPSTTDVGPTTTHTSCIDILSAETDQFSTLSRPLVQVEIARRQGLIYIDSGAKNSIAGHVLYTYFCKMNLPCREELLQMILADGQVRRVQMRIFESEIVLQGRRIPTTFLAVPDHVNSKTLLGIDFITNGQLILDILKGQWFFEENPLSVFDFFQRAYQ
ncbi:hypothetical protein NQ314_013275 [Rhamnusium bicolor]|uniref:CCHC-type domain-containing protein n=1 Tax=Rhamnusium bicolor TaxID=1586634 RepID=A0AAV8X7G6_9CUCU|nr:hypothetical protein NQ314_013275 [Rhamnusium bicolor]